MIIEEDINLDNYINGLFKTDEPMRVKKGEVKVKRVKQKQEILEKYTKTDEENKMVEINLNIEKEIQTEIEKLKLDDKIKSVVSKELEEIKPNQITITGVKKTATLKKKLHVEFEKILKIITATKKLYMSGDAGTGKTTIAKDIASAYLLPFASISCSNGMSESHLLGRMLFNGEYVETEFVKLFENGGVFLFDEIDSADSNTLLVLNQALENGTLAVPNRRNKPVATMHKDFICVCAGNTFGNGSADYTGRNILDMAFMDRFTASKIEIKYDVALEKSLMGQYKTECNKLHTIRKAMENHRISKIMSTRMFKHCKNYLDMGMKFNEVLDIFTCEWSKEEKDKIKSVM